MHADFLSAATEVGLVLANKIFSLRLQDHLPIPISEISDPIFLQQSHPQQSNYGMNLGITSESQVSDLPPELNRSVGISATVFIAELGLRDPRLYGQLFMRKPVAVRRLISE